jgi:cell division transport system permease protein
MRISTFGYFFNEALKGMWRNRLMATASIGSVAVSILILSTFLLVAFNVDHLSSYLESQVEITVYLSDDLKDQDIAAIGKDILGYNGVEEIVYFTKADSLEMMRERMGEKSYLLDIFEEDNPFPNFYRIKVEDPSVIEGVAYRIGRLEGIEKVDYGRDFVESLINATNFLRAAVIVLSLVLALVAIFIISNTIKITVFARRREINIMKYVGATDWFIRWPFFIEGIFLGVVGSGIAIGLMWISYTKIYENVMYNFPIIPLITPESILLEMSKWFLVFGVVLGAVGTSLSVRKFLKV